MLGRCAGLGAGVVLWCVAAVGLAQGADDSSDAEARALFNAGQVAYEDARFDDALGYFKRAHELSGRPALLFNIASAAERVRDDRLALDAYQEYLEAMPEAPNRRFAEGRIRFLEDALASREAQDAPERVDEGARVPTPEEAARQDAGERALAPVSEGAPEDEAKGGVIGKWWFWTALGVVLVAGVATGVALAMRGSGGGVQDPLQGDLGSGGVVVTLGGGGP